MTHLALNMSGLRNGVSKLHGHVSREMFRHFHGSIPTEEVPIQHITNGVHLETWLAPSLIQLYGKYLPKNWTKKHEDLKMWQAIDKMPDEEYREVHKQLKKDMISFARNNIKEHRRRNGFDQAKIDEVDSYLDENKLTIGFARRFATYKRATLLFRDLERLKNIVNHPTKPVQFVFGGKAHPADKPGQELIKEIYRLSQLDDFRGKVVLLENYDMNMARHLVQGVDIWLNNPLRPYEASGTSGQKAAMNGVCNFSILDGWWEEGFNGENGWAIDTVDLELDVDTQSHQNSINMYEKLENVIAPLYYDKQAEWMQHVKSSIKTLAPVYSTQRMVQDYTRDLYVPTIQRGNRFKENHYDLSVKIADYKRFISENWHHVQIISVDDRMSTPVPVPMKKVSATLSFGPIWLQDTVVEIIYYEESNGTWNPVVVTMEDPERVAYHTYKFSAQVPAHLKHGPHFTVRVRPVNPNFATSFELPVVTSN
jgi:starch phosphorylase